MSNQDRGNPSQSQAPSGSVVSIMPEIAMKRARDERVRASTTHRREIEAAAEFRENEVALAALDYDAAIATIEDDTSPEGRTALAELLSGRGMQRCLRGDVDSGFADWAAAIATDPKSADPYLMRARWLGRTDVAAALEDHHRAVTAEPSHAVAYARRGDCYRQLGDEDRAIADYRRSIGLDPKVSDTHYLLAVLLAKARKHKEALASYNTAIRLAPNYVEFLMGRAMTLEALRDFKAAARDYERVLELDPTREDARDQLALCRGDVTKVKALIAKTAEALVGDGSEADAPDDHETLATLGSMQLMLGEREAAIGLLTRALALKPNDVASLAKRGTAYWDTKAFQPSLDDFDAAVALAPDDPEHHVGRAKALAALTRFGEAVEASARAIALAPNHVFAHRLRAVYRSHAEDTEESTAKVGADLRRAAELAPHEVVIVREYFEHAMHLGEVTAAIPILDAAIAIHPENGWLYFARGYCRSRFDEDPDHEKTYENESEADRTARCNAALADLNKALDLGEHNELSYHEILRIAEESKDRALQLATLERAHAAEPDDEIHKMFLRSWFPARAAELGLGFGRGSPGYDQ